MSCYRWFFIIIIIDLRTITKSDSFDVGYFFFQLYNQTYNMMTTKKNDATKRIYIEREKASFSMNRFFSQFCFTHFPLKTNPKKYYCKNIIRNFFIIKKGEEMMIADDRLSA